MRIRLDRYIIREMVVPFLIGTLTIVMMFQANSYIAIAKELNLENIPLVARFQWILYQTPGYLKLTLPTGMSFAAALAMTRLARESELTALRAAGVRVVRVVFPMFLFGALVGLGDFYMVDKILPISERKAAEIANKNAILGIVDNNFATNRLIQLDKYAASFGQVQRTKDDQVQIKDIMLVERSQDSVTRLITAKTGSYFNNVWRFQNAMVYQVDGINILPIQAKDMVINQRQALDQLFSNSIGYNSGRLQEMPTAELRASILSTVKAKGNPKPYQVELFQRYAVAASCAIFSITSPVFAVFFARSGGFVGVLVSLVVVVLYYNAYIISTVILPKYDYIPAWLAAWLPNILFGVMGLLALRRLE